MAPLKAVRQSKDLEKEWEKQPRWRGIQHGYTGTKHQREVGTGYFDEVAKVISDGEASTIALDDSMEASQF